ncbi:MAG: flavodoxin [Planctomycetota bacterium]
MLGEHQSIGKIGIFFGSDTGNTQRVAEMICDLMSPLELTAQDIDDCEVSELVEPDVILLGVSTWNFGEIQCSWDDKLEELADQDLAGKRIGLFGLGDCVNYADTFVDGLGILWESLGKERPKLIGKWSTEGYDYIASRGLVDDDHFLGLVIDEDTEPELTDERVQRWVAQIQSELGLELRAAG